MEGEREGGVFCDIMAKHRSLPITPNHFYFSIRPLEFEVVLSNPMSLVNFPFDGSGLGNSH
jgi:hypothetical protein